MPRNDVPNEVTKSVRSQSRDASREGEERFHSTRERYPHETSARGGSKREGADREDTAQREAGGRFRKPADELDKLARALRFTGDQVQGPLSGPLTRTAAGVENAAQRLREASAQDVVQTIEGFARRRPLAFLGVAALVGFGGSRFFKSSSASRSAS